MSRIAPRMKTDTGVDFRFHTGQVEIFTKQDELGNEMRFLRGVASDDKIDRHGERFSKNALARMAETAKANLTLFGDHFHSWENTLGRAVEAAVNPQGQFEVVFQLENEEAQPKIRQLWAKLMGKTKLALSVGGRILKTFIEDAGGQQVRVLDDIELLEVSIVGIPANPRTWVEAIVKSMEEPGEKQNREEKMDEIQTLKAEIERLTARAGELEKEALQVTTERNRLKDQVGKLEGDIQEKDAALAKIREKADGLQAEFDRLSNALNEMQAAYDDLRAKYEQAQPAVMAGKKYRDDLAFEAHRLAGLVEGNGFNSDNTKTKLAALSIDDLKKEIDGLRKRVDEKFPAAGQSIHAPFDGQHAGDDRQAKVRDMLNEGAPLFQDRRVNSDG